MKQGLNNKEMFYAKNSIHKANITLVAIQRHGNKEQIQRFLNQLIEDIDKDTLLHLQELIDNKLNPEQMIK